MKGLFIPEITAEMFRNGCLESIEALMAEGEIYDIEYKPERKGKWIRHDEIKNVYGGNCIECSECGEKYVVQHIELEKYCRNCGADMRGEEDAEIH